MNIHYQLTGSVEVPEGSQLSETETGIILPDGSIIKLWEAWERHRPGEDDHCNLSDAELMELEISYDTLSHMFEEA